METKQNKNKMKNTKEFKSYYVVWKLNEIYEEIEKKNRFKSYYVVWKPIW